MSKEKQINFICKECPHKVEFQSYGNRTKNVYCEHPDKKYISEYFEQHGISKYPTFLGYINTKGIFPVKKSPKWCPLKKKGGAE
jgi:hypothetical protein